MFETRFEQFINLADNYISHKKSIKKKKLKKIIKNVKLKLAYLKACIIQKKEKHDANKNQDLVKNIYNLFLHS